MKATPSASAFLSILFFSSLGPCRAAQFIQKRALVAPVAFPNGWEHQGCYVYEPPNVSIPTIDPSLC